MKAIFSDIRYKPLKFANKFASYDIEIRGERKRIRVVRTAFGYISPKKDVYVQILEKDQYPIPNRLRRARLYFVQDDDFNVPTLGECYIVLNKSAGIFSWVDSEFGWKHKFMEAENPSLIPAIDIEGLKATFRLVHRRFAPLED